MLFKNILREKPEFKSEIGKNENTHRYRLLKETFCTSYEVQGIEVQGTNYYIVSENKIYKMRSSCDKSVLEGYTYEEAVRDIDAANVHNERTLKQYVVFNDALPGDVPTMTKRLIEIQNNLQEPENRNYLFKLYDDFFMSQDVREKRQNTIFISLGKGDVYVDKLEMVDEYIKEKEADSGATEEGGRKRKRRRKSRKRIKSRKRGKSSGRRRKTKRKRRGKKEVEEDDNYNINNLNIIIFIISFSLSFKNNILTLKDELLYNGIYLAPIIYFLPDILVLLVLGYLGAQIVGWMGA